MSPGPRGSLFSASVSSTEVTKTISVSFQTFDTLSSPCDYLTTQLSSRIKAECLLPVSAVLSCSLISFSILSDAKRIYKWTVTATWTE